MKSFFLLFFLSLNALAVSWESSGTGKLLELYTSQGCSSCPPADAFLSTYTTNKDLWKTVVPLSFHVSYWDHLGWKDPYASSEAVERQRRLSNQLSQSTVYTPQFFFDGQNGRGEGDSGKSTYTLSAKWNGKNLSVTVTPALPSGKVFYAFQTMDQVTDVRAGENAGKKLKHEFVVTHFDSPGVVSKKEFPLLQPDEKKAKVLSVWIEVNGKPVVAVADWIK